MDLWWQDSGEIWSSPSGCTAAPKKLANFKSKGEQGKARKGKGKGREGKGKGKEREGEGEGEGLLQKRSIFLAFDLGARMAKDFFYQRERRLEEKYG